jgi:predicted nuclease of predicted toxin-antitoxin system
MSIVADESVDFGIIKGIRQKGFQVLSITEDFSGIKDQEVLNIAVKNNSLLLTEDKDFGELTYRLRLEHKGILLIRLSDLPRNERIRLVIETMELHSDTLENNFSVLSNRGLRIKTSLNKPQ